MPFNTASTASQWWILITASSTAGSGWRIISGPASTIKAKYNGAVKGPYTSEDAANKAAQQLQGQGIIGTSPPPGTNLIGADVTNWMKGLGGSLASGIEGGVITTLKDLWNVIVGPLEVFAGIAIAIFVFIIYFKDDIMKLAPMIAMAAA